MLSGTDVCCSSGLLWTTPPVCVCSLIPVSFNCTILAGGRPCVNSTGRWCRDSGFFRLPFVQFRETLCGGLRLMIIGRDFTGNFKCVFHPYWRIPLRNGTNLLVQGQTCRFGRNNQSLWWWDLWNWTVSVYGWKPMQCGIHDEERSLGLADEGDRT